MSESLIERVVRVVEETEASHYNLLFNIEEKRLTVAAICSDTFWWGCADAEEITEDNFDLFKQTLEECASLPEATSLYPIIYATELFAARMRKLRPQGASYPHYPVCMWPLFDACGPERVVDIGNPKKQPTADEVKDRWAARKTNPEEVEKAVRDLLAADGHKTQIGNPFKQCSFTGCDCGGVENYNVARATAVELIRKLDYAKEKSQKTA